MKKNYLVIAIAVIILLAVIIVIRLNSNVPYAVPGTENSPGTPPTSIPEKPQAAKEYVSINQQLNLVTAMNFDKLMANYAENAELDWEGSSLEGKYQGKDKIGEFWKGFFSNAKIVSSDFRINDEQLVATFSFSRKTNGKTEILKGDYQVQLGDQGKIIKEAWIISK